MLVWLLASVLVLNVGAKPAHALTDEQKLLNEVWRIVDRAYVDSTFNHQNWWLVRQKVLKQAPLKREDTYTAIQQMLAGLDDPYTRLLKPDQYRSLQTNTSGELSGVGLQIAQDPDTGDLRVITPIEGSPADRAGLQPRDRILKIDGAPATDLTLDEAAERMRGPAGSRVVLTVARDEDTRNWDVELVRDRITINPVYAEFRPQPDGTKVGYIRLTQFSANAAEEVAHAVARMEQQDANAYVLDLRNNPGGLLQAGIDIARLWLRDSTIVYTVNRDGIQDSFSALSDPLTDDPLIVLVNQGTASASEILAGALQDNGRAQLIGEKTFGKGLIQSLFNLSDGSGLAVTIARYETPNHRDINRLGIEPDRTVPLSITSREQVATDADEQYQAAIEVLTQQVVVAGAAG
ncbi:MAG: S41 family peptidase [Cyanobacteria bacterium J069]